MGLTVVGLLIICTVTSPRAQSAAHKVIIDTDIGDDIDDAFAIALLLNCPELEVVGITTVHDDAGTRARIVCKMLRLADRASIAVAAGPGHGDPNQAPWAADFEATKPVDTPAPQFLVQQINAHPGEITLVPIGPLTNLAAALDLDPTIAGKLKGIVAMGGSAYVGYNLQPPPCAEYNIHQDIAAAKRVYSAGIPTTMVGLDVTAMLRFEADMRAQLAARGLPLTDALMELYRLWGHETPILYDPMALSMVIDSTLCQTERRRVVVDDEGMTRLVEGEPNVTVCVKPDVERFFRFYLDRVVKPGRPT